MLSSRILYADRLSPQFRSLIKAKLCACLSAYTPWMTVRVSRTTKW
jgi:hypothetical protein